jgi:hypothetical protein
MNNKGGILGANAGVADAAQHEVLQAANDPGVVGTEHQRVTDHDPQHRDDPNRDEGLGHRGEDVPFVDQSSVEEGQSGHHEKDQRGRREHPSGITGVHVHMTSQQRCRSFRFERQKLD